MNSSFEIGSRLIGRNEPPFIVAELSANHHQDFDRAVSLVRAAADVGVDAVKLQTYTPDTMTLDCRSDCFWIRGTPWDGQRLFDLYRDAHMPWGWYDRLRPVADDLGLQLFSTAFDGTAVDYLEQLGAPAYKIASFELVDLPLLKRVARTRKPVILSTGMGSLIEIREAVDTLREAGCRDLALLKCTSAYPALASEMNLRAIPHLADTFGVPVGISDHTLEPVVPVVAVTLGASIIEKHLTLSRSEPGPDTEFSLEPDEFKNMVNAVRTTMQALGSVRDGPTEREASSLKFRRSLFVVQDVLAGEPFTLDNVRSIRPGNGLPPRCLDEVVTRVAARSIARGTPLSWTLTAAAEAEATRR